MGAYLTEMTHYFKEFGIIAQQFTQSLSDNIKKLRCDVQGQEYKASRELPSRISFLIHPNQIRD